MKLKDLLSALKTQEIKVMIVDVEGNELIRFYSDGYRSVEEDILERQVKHWNLLSANSISVVILNPENTNTTDTNGAQPYNGD
jgi:hypothetical protein